MFRSAFYGAPLHLCILCNKLQSRPLIFTIKRGGAVHYQKCVARNLRRLPQAADRYFYNVYGHQVCQICLFGFETLQDIQ